MKDFNRASITWTVKEMVRLANAGKIKFDNAVQRGLVWDDGKKSLLIDSILQGYEIPPMYAKKGEGNVYDMLDGKQRCNAILDYVANKFSLTELSEELESYDNLCFDQLDAEDQDIIMSYALKVTYFDGISDADVQEIFYRLNNGKPLSTYEQTRVKAKSLNEVQALSQMSLFNSDKTGRKYPGYKKEELIFRLMMTLTEESPDLERKSLTEYIRTHTITEEEQERAFDAFKLYATITDAVLSTATPEDKKQKQKIYKRLLSPTHMLSVIPYMVRAVEDLRSTTQMRLWLETFFSGKKRASIDETYNDNASRGSAKRAALMARHDALERSYLKFMEENKV